MSAVTFAFLVACGPDGPEEGPAPTRWHLPLPASLPEPAVPEDNPATEEKFELGRHLFYDPRLSGNGTQACADCHAPDLAFTDNLATPVGSTGDGIPRNSMALVNVAWNATYTWPNPLLRTLEDQLLVPMFAEHPVEMGMTGHLPEIQARLAADAVYPALGASAFPEDDPWADENLVRALATFVRGLVSADSPYDQATYGGSPDAMSDAAQRGKVLFFSERTECYHCHGGVNFTTSFVRADSTVTPNAFFNNGLYNLDGLGSYPATNQGLFAITQRPEDMGRFRTPSLRNVAVTAPYMHDGSIDTLDEVIAHYDRGGRLIADGPNAGDGAQSPLKDPLVRPLALTDAEKADLKAFLESLTDEAFLNDPRFQDPWATE
jgi:cytochrome c peroxidase